MSEDPRITAIKIHQAEAAYSAMWARHYRNAAYRSPPDGYPWPSVDWVLTNCADSIRHAEAAAKSSKHARRLLGIET